jgi:hypothetical protein
MRKDMRDWAMATSIASIEEAASILMRIEA